MPLPFNLPCTVAGVLLLGLAASCGSKDSSDPAPQPPVVPPVATGPSQVALWTTTSDKGALFYKSTLSINFGEPKGQNPTIDVDTTQTYQTIDGFGYTLTGGSALLINKMSAAARATLLKELFATDGNNIGTSYLRISIGASDLDASVFTYNESDLPDPTLAKFSIAPDKENLIPVLKEILAINPSIKILGSPWTAPTWMKTNNSFVGGSLKPEYYSAYAQYFIKYLQAMQAEGIRIDAVTLQNEPLNPYNNPSMEMSAQEQATFIRDHVGPAFKAAGLTTKIILYDHNPDRVDYPITVLQDAQARQYVDGSAFHLYLGNISALNNVHNAAPDKNVYFTEQWTKGSGKFSEDFKWHISNLIIGATRNWSRNVLEWNLASDQNYGPHTPGGCTECIGAVTVEGNTVTRNTAYYTIAHAAKFVRPGSVRISTTTSETLPNVAFKNPEGKKVLIVLNAGSSLQTFNIRYRGKVATGQLAAGAVGTYIW